MKRIVLTVLLSVTPYMAFAQTDTLGEGALIDSTNTVEQSPVLQSKSITRYIQVNNLVDSLLEQNDATVNNSSSWGTNTVCGAASYAQSYGLLERVTPQEGINHNYVPTGLVGLNGRFTVRGTGTVCVIDTVADALETMFNDMKLAGLDPVITSGYRSYGQQASLYNVYAPRFNTGTYKRVAQPGHSEHQLGTAVDLAGQSGGYMAGNAFGYSAEYYWLQQHAHKYGFVPSYGKHKEYLTGYQFEPWHWRYVGTEAASILREFDHSLAHQNEYQSPRFVVEALLGVFSLFPQSNVEIGG